MTDDEPDYDETHRHVNESIGASVSLDLTRGTGTRDQEKWCIKGKGATADDAIDELRTQLEEIVGGLSDDEPLATQTRAFDPDTKLSYANAEDGDE